MQNRPDIFFILLTDSSLSIAAETVVHQRSQLSFWLNTAPADHPFFAESQDSSHLRLSTPVTVRLAGGFRLFSVCQAAEYHIILKKNVILITFFIKNYVISIDIKSLSIYHFRGVSKTGFERTEECEKCSV